MDEDDKQHIENVFNEMVKANEDGTPSEWADTGWAMLCLVISALILVNTIPVTVLFWKWAF